MSTKRTVLITDRFTQEAQVLLAQPSFIEVRQSAQPQVTPDDLKGVHGLVIRSRTELTEAHFAKAKDLQVVVTATSGFDHIDLKSANKWGITVMHTPEANVESAAQVTWSLVLSCAQKLFAAREEIKSGKWNRSSIVGMELYGKTYGIVGLGRIGRRIAEIANAFGMHVMAYDPYTEDAAFKEFGAERTSYEEILRASHVLSFHVPKTAETMGMMRAPYFESLDKDCILINTSRGGVIHEDSLIDALRQGHIRAVGLDVYEREPLNPTSALCQFPNVVLSPHIGANTSEAFAKASEQAAEKIRRFFMDGTTSDTLPPKAAWYKL